jgi:hypothetical protein
LSDRELPDLTRADKLVALALGFFTGVLLGVIVWNLGTH